MTLVPTRLFVTVLKLSLLALLFSLAAVSVAQAANLTIAPATGVYTVGQTFTVQIRVDTKGETINAAEGTVSFNANELAVLNVSKGSVFNLWTSDPTFSNAAGTIEFSGGTPTGYSGSNGVVISATMQAKVAGSPRLRMTDGAVLAADGRGTNILSSMNGGSYTVQAAAMSPEPETIEYVASVNTPGAPQITSTTHTDETTWHKDDTAELTWTLPSGVTAVRTLLDNSARTIPTKVYDDPISSITLENLEEGVQYFHLQFQNSDGWGQVAHYRLAIDTQAPTDFTLAVLDAANTTNPAPTIQATFTEEESTVARYLVKIDDAEPYEYIDETGSSTIPLPTLSPGYHVITVEAFDAAGNSVIETISHTIEAFTAPRFTDVPSTISDGVIPVIQGETVPNAVVTVTIAKLGTDGATYTVTSDDNGRFQVIPDGQFATGVYELSAYTVDQQGAQSATSDPVRLAVQEPNMIRVGAFLVSVLSVVVPLLALVFISIIGFVLMITKIRRFRRGVRKEAGEVVTVATSEFTALETVLEKETAKLQKTRKTNKLTKAESALLTAISKKVREAKQRIEKEAHDVEDTIE